MSGKSFHHTTILRPCSYFRCFCEYTLIVKCILVALPMCSCPHPYPNHQLSGSTELKGCIVPKPGFWAGA